MLDSELILQNSAIFYFLIALFSLVIGSLLNVIIYRLPLMLMAEQLAECAYLLNLSTTENRKINLFLPRSFCPNCNNTVKAIDNIPVLSYIALRGRCRYCQVPISWRYPMIEVLSCLLGLYASWHFGFGIALIFSLIFIWITLCLVFIDLDHQLLPDSLTLLLLWLGLIANTQALFTALPNAVLSAAGAYFLLWLFIKIFYLITGKIGMGHGDFKLFAAFGAWFGWTVLPLILLLSSITGAIVGLIYLKLKKQSKDTPIPFGPFLCIAGLVTLFWGQKILTLYLSYWS
ncbi:type 4 (IV) prepilin-like protein leader peptide processing enzyme PilD [Legionella beliardensis]|uniref:Prepilin leader peptidase/N-methyltransferase n=1 Tax=Legionella beliardensis TaxID=91822 RepID=A0A378I2Y4_9GAMM|nr:A24 family peptidase [Legionella beliardensis]STX29100.1 type 4 (IV) prepilin-like protein leader peptide processing enzyme PilD [Legionella beliardensis]